MAKRTSIQQAAANALSAWLQRRLGDDVTVSPRWFEPDVELPPKAISVILAGKRLDTPLDPELVSSTLLADNAITAVWKVAEIDQPVQLDVFATSDVARDDVLARLDDFLHTGTAETIFQQVNGSATEQGILFNLDDGWGGTVDVYFEGPSLQDSADNVQQRYHRATLQGHMYAMLTVTTQGPRMASIVLKQQTAEILRVPVGTEHDVATMTADATTYTRVP